MTLPLPVGQIVQSHSTVLKEIDMSTNLFSGRWNYRSFRNKRDSPGDEEQFAIWANAEAVFEEAVDSKIKGQLKLSIGTLDLNGTAEVGTDDSSTIIKLDAVAASGPLYAVSGRLVEPWPDGKNQVDAVVGSVINVGDPRYSIGEVGWFIMLRLN